MRKSARALHASETGTTAVEFAMVAPVLIAMLLGVLALCIGLFQIGCLHYAVEEGARCASINPTTCTGSAATIAYAQKHYYGPSLTPTFTYAAAACGNSVSASINYSMDIGFKTFVIPIVATACFP